jgi:alpha-glucoside transport system substrate-binding protein
MKNRLFSFLGLLLIVALALSACAPAATPAAPTAAPAEPTAVPAEPTAAPTEAPAEPTAAPTEAPAAAASTIDCTGVTAGDTITMLYQWSGQEEAKINAILKPFVDACGVVVQPESTRDQALLDTRVNGGTPPDVTFWNVAQLEQYKDKLIPMDKLGAHSENYADFFVSPGTIDGKWLGLPVKADVKTLIWYSPVVFEAKGYTVPTTFEELDALVEKMVADGNVPWSMGMESGDATGWTGSDTIQDLLLVKQGPDYVNNIMAGEVAYNDAGVKEVYEIYGKWAIDPKYTVGGAKGTLSTNFNDAIYKVFSDPPEAMMVRQSGFAAGQIASKYPDLKYGTDYDFFPFPGAKGLQGGFDWMMSFKNSPAVMALVTYLSSPLGGANWAKANFGESPNKGANGQYTQPDLVKYGEMLANAQGFTPDIGDTIPGGFGKAEWTAIVNYVNGKPLDAELANVAKAQSDALKK